MNSFNSEDVTRHFHRPSTSEERLLDKAEQLVNLQISHSEKLSQIAASTQRTANWTEGAATQLAGIRTVLVIIAALIAAIAGKLFVG